MNRSASLYKGPLRILVAEDNDIDFMILHRHIKKLLEPEGLIRVRNRAELHSRLYGNFDLIIADANLTDIASQELFNTIASAQPDVPCLVISGSITYLAPETLPSSVFAIVEKGDFHALETALIQHLHLWNGTSC